jgi:hypothetical protein
MIRSSSSGCSALVAFSQTGLTGSNVWYWIQREFTDTAAFVVVRGQAGLAINCRFPVVQASRTAYRNRYTVLRATPKRLAMAAGASPAASAAGIARLSIVAERPL